MRYIYLILVIALLTGCGINDKVTIVAECRENKVYITMYKANLVHRDENIISPRNIRNMGYANPAVRCVKDKK